MAYNKEKQLKENIDAIRCALRLSADHRAPSKKRVPSFINIQDLEG